MKVENLLSEKLLFRKLLSRELLVRVSLMGVLLAMAFAVFASPALAQEEPPPGGPVHAVDDRVTTTQDKKIVINVLANDYSTNPGEVLMVAHWEPPMRGSVSCSFEGECTYTPPNGSSGIDIFTYLVCGDVECDEGTVTVVIYPAEEPPPNNAPVANDDSGSMAHNTTATFDVVMGEESTEYSGQDTDADEPSENLYVMPSSVTPLIKVSDSSVAGTVVCNDSRAGVFMHDCRVDPDASVSGESVKFTYKVEDSEEHMSNRATVTVRVGEEASADNEPPSVSLDSPASGASVGGSVDLKASASDSGGVKRVEFLVDGNVVGTDESAPYEAAWDSTPVSEGSHELKARAYDAAGNFATSGARAVVVDNLDPESSITSGPAQDDLVRSTSAVFSFSSTDGDAFECQLDGGAVETCAANKTYADLSQGSHTLKVWAVGSAGRDADLEATPSERTWTVDMVAPAGTVKINKGAAKTRKLGVTLNLAAADPAPASGVSEMRFSNDGRTWTGWRPHAATSKWSLKKGKAGTRTVFVEFADTAGNTSAMAKDTIRYKP